MIMGGHGSTRWRWYSKKYTVDDCLRAEIKSFKIYLRPGYNGRLTRYVGGGETACVGYSVEGDDTPIGVRFFYSFHNGRARQKVEYNYFVWFTTTTHLGSLRYWWICPNCHRRVGILYIPPGEKRFACRLCHNLTYRSCQEQRKVKALYKRLAAEMQDKFPGITWEDIWDLWEDKPIKRILKGPIWDDCIGDVIERINQDPYNNYLNADELIEQSGLTHDELEALAEARLLVPDRPDGRYRPKLVGWGKKLSYLLMDGWDIEGIKRWVKGRWETSNPRKWPPDRLNGGKTARGV